MTEPCPIWRVKHRAVTESTNTDARAGEPGDVFTADFQTAGRGRLDHQWLSPFGENLMMSAVIGVSDMPPEEVVTLPLVVGLAVVEAAEALLAERDAVEASTDLWVKWPNDVLIGGRKVCGILCERKDDRVIVGIGINVNQTMFDDGIAARATSLLLAVRGSVAQSSAPEVELAAFSIPSIRDSVLAQLASLLVSWRQDGFRAIWPQIAARDFLKGRTVSVRRTDGDTVPVTGPCGGICVDGSLEIAGEPVFAGEVFWRDEDILPIDLEGQI